MKQYINTSNYFLSTLTEPIEANLSEGYISLSDDKVDGVELPSTGYFWLDVDFNDSSLREIFRIDRKENSRVYHFDMRISPNGKNKHLVGAVIGLRDFAEIFNSLSRNTDNFGQVEAVDASGDALTIRVFGGNVFVPGQGYKSLGTYTRELTSKKDGDYDVLYDFYAESEASSVLVRYQGEGYVRDDNLYYLAKVTVSDGKIKSITDFRSIMVSGGARGAMLEKDYNPRGITPKDIYDVDSLDESNTRKFVTPEEKEEWTNKQDKLISGDNIKKVYMSDGTLVDLLENAAEPLRINTILSVGTYQQYIQQPGEVMSVVLDKKPLDDSAFIVMSKTSGIILAKGEDYVYDYDTNTVTFTKPFAPNEEVMIWIIFNSGTSEGTIGNGALTIKYGEESLGVFTANQSNDDDVTVNIPVPVINNSTITFKQGGEIAGSFTLNQADNKDIELGLKGMEACTQEEYDEHPERETDGNFYLIYEE